MLTTPEHRQAVAVLLHFFYLSGGELPEGLPRLALEHDILPDVLNCTLTALIDKNLILRCPHGTLMFNDDREREARELYAQATGEEACAKCGCTQTWACDGGCWWISPNLCSTCADSEHA